MESILSIKEVKKVYKDGTCALKGISLEVPKGCIYGLLGPNGAGKTTLISIMTTLLSKTEGKVYVDGIDLDNAPDTIRKLIGVTFQESINERDLTGMEILISHGALYGMRAGEVAKRTEDMLNMMGLSDVANKYVNTYSGGMRRRLEIIKGMMTEPTVLFLDEPTLGLDPQSRHQIWNFLKEIKKKGTTIFVTSHYIDEIERNADHVAFIDRGKVIEQGVPSTLTDKYSKLNSEGKSTLEDIFLYFIEHSKGGTIE